jgi:uncharacterized protein
MSSKPTPRFTVITLGVSDMRASIAFYEALGFARKFRATGEAVAFFDTGGTVIGLFPWDQLARDATLPDQPRPKTFRGSTLAWNCASVEEVDTVLNFAISCGASLLKPAHRLRRLFRLFRRSRRPPLGSRGRARHRGRRRPAGTPAGLNLAVLPQRRFSLPANCRIAARWTRSPRRYQKSSRSSS